MIELLSNPQTWISLFTLTILEIVLGIDNLVFISVVTQRLPQKQQKPARQFGLALACVSRILLLAAVVWMTRLTQPLFTLFGQAFSINSLVLLGGGLFLLVKGTNEIHEGVTAESDLETKTVRTSIHFSLVIIQIVILDIIFSLDSVFTAVGIAQEFIIMSAAIVIAIALMIWASEILNSFMQKYPTLKMLALSFLLLVGIVLIADGLSFHIPRGYLYFAIAFSMFVEILNISARRRRARLKRKVTQKRM